MISKKEYEEQRHIDRANERSSCIRNVINHLEKHVRGAGTYELCVLSKCSQPLSLLDAHCDTPDIRNTIASLQ